LLSVDLISVFGAPAAPALLSWLGLCLWSIPLVSLGAALLLLLRSVLVATPFDVSPRYRQDTLSSFIRSRAVIAVHNRRRCDAQQVEQRVVDRILYILAIGIDVLRASVFFGFLAFCSPVLRACRPPLPS